MAAKEVTFGQQADSSSHYTILTLAQLYYVIDEAPKVNQLPTNMLWKETDSFSIEGAKISRMETTWLPSKILNSKYRILAERASDKALVLLCEGENSITGRQKVDGYWKDIQAALKRSCVIGTIPYLEARALGHYQEPTAVIEGPNSLVGQPSAEFYQTIFYGTVRKRGSRNVTAVSSFYINEVDEKFTLHFGIAQCSIPSQKMLDKKGDLPRAKGFVSKLFEGKKKRMMPMRINYINEMSKDQFNDFLKKNVNSCYISYLRYLRSSIDCMVDIVCGEEDTIAIQKTLVEDLSRKFYKDNYEKELDDLQKRVAEINDEEQQQCDDLEKDAEGLNDNGRQPLNDQEKEEEQLNDNEKQYLEILKQFEIKLENPPENQNKDILLYMHGFNNSLEESLLRASQIACDIGFSGRLAVFSWPSVERCFGYFKDKEQIDMAISQFVEFLEIILECARKVHIIAHSAANLLFTRSATIIGTLLAQYKGKIGQLICAHADVQVDAFQHAFKGTERIPGIEQMVDHVTIYYHQHDRALWLSGDSIIGTGHRLGRQNKEKLSNSTKLDNVDIGEKNVSKESSLGYFSGLSIKHNVYAENPLILEDMSEIINEGLKAHQRKNIRVLCRCGKSKCHDLTIDPSCQTCKIQYSFVIHSSVCE